jgi:peptidoglycan/xylan/chitin deacetylase (PgdA/CDA1 family)
LAVSLLLLLLIQALPAENHLPRQFTWGSQIILENLWSPAELRGEAPKNPALTPSPSALVKPQTALAPLPAPWHNAIRKVTPLNNRKVAALTFDLCEGAQEVSGYDAGVVNYLRAQRVKATFFAGGKWMRSHPEQTLQLMADPLFEMGNHSWSHRNFRGLSRGDMEDQIQRTQVQYEALRQELARRVKNRGLDLREMEKIPKALLTFRFPYGTCNAEALSTTASLGLPAIQWDIVTGDPDRRQTAANIAKIILSRIQPGSIIIAHANGRGLRTAEALPLVIPQLRALGFELVTISELLHLGLVVATPDCH